MNFYVATKNDSCRLPLICRICGDIARGLNFDVMTCMACKAFFRRNALRKMTTLQCKRKFNCEITIRTRTRCSACRLRKCFESGMKPHLIRAFNQTKNVYKNFGQPIAIMNQEQIPISQPLDLFSNNHSAIVSKQIDFLSNIIHMYDEQNIMNNITCLFTEGGSLGDNLSVKQYLY